MYTKLAHCRRLLLFCILMSQIYAENGTITCSYAKIFRREPKTIDISSLENKNYLTTACKMARKLSLKGESTLTLSGVDNIPVFVNWIFWAKELEMCVSVENAENLKEVLIETESVVGTCEGPLLSIVNNANLKTIEIRNNKLGKNLSSVVNAIRVRGNRKLNGEDLEDLKILRSKVDAKWDLQPQGECALPKPFTSFETLDQNCTNFYGPLTLQEGLTEFQYDLSKVHKFDIEGCIQIQKTELKDVAFLSAFSRFSRMQYCNQFIRDNKKLCPKNLNYLNVFFKDIQFSNNADEPCGECIGGQVTDHYLRESMNCSIIYGDLIIANFRGIPSSFKNLRGIEEIEGRLIIINNTGLNKFDYLISLKKVGRSNESGAAIIVKDNGDLSFLELPGLLDIHLDEGEGRIELANNPLLGRVSQEAQPLNTEVVKRYTSFEEHEDSTSTAATTAFQDSENLGSLAKKEEASPRTQRISNKAIFGGFAAVASLILLCSLATFFAHRRNSSAVHLRQTPYELHAKSKEKVSSSSTGANRSVVRSKGFSSATDASSTTSSTSSSTEKAKRSPQVSQPQRQDNPNVSGHR